MKILLFNFSRLRNAEYLLLSKDLLKITKSYDWTATDVQNHLTCLQESIIDLTAQLNKKGVVNKTQVIVLADNAFGDAWRAVKYVTKAFLLSPSPLERVNAAILNKLISSHGCHLHTENCEVQNATAKMFLNDCANKPEVKTAIRALGINNFIANMETALEALLATIAHRKNKNANELEEDETREIRNRLADHLIKMFKYLEVMSEITPSMELDQMIKQINVSIQKIETAIKKRRYMSPELEETGIS